MTGRTSFLIAHRLSTIQNCDEILMLDRGQLVQRGTHDELLRQEGLFRKLYEIQHRQFKAGTKSLSTASLQ
jgi:ABC-type multidrug transport system fused ATPase/permease subunit